MRNVLYALAGLPLAIGLGAACSASSGASNSRPPGGGSAGAGGADGGPACGFCSGDLFTPCDEQGAPLSPISCDPGVCTPDHGCVTCVPGATVCDGNEVHRCSADGSGAGELVETCDVANGSVCNDGKCGSACAVAADQPSNVGCEFWAVDLDQQDGAGNDPASAPWGVVLSNAGEAVANVTIELNDAPPGQPLQTSAIAQISILPGNLRALALPTRELDCGTKPNDYASPGTCLSSRAYRITSSAPIVVYQFNVFENAFSNDASLLLPTNALGRTYRVVGWPAGHPATIPNIPLIGVDRSYVTIVGTKPNTHVTVHPTWRIRGNPPISATPAGGQIDVTLGPFDVLNLETDDATLQEAAGEWPADLSGTAVQASEPVAVFSGVESTLAPYSLQVPTPPGWVEDDTCCLDHLEEQLFPAESVGTNYVVTRSPVRSIGGFQEPDVLRFVGVAETATVTTNLPPPFDTFTIQPGEVKTTWTQSDVVVSATKPVTVAQILVSNRYVAGAYVGDPSLTVYPPVEQFRTQYLILTPDAWTSTYVVVAAEVGAAVTIDGNPTTACVTAPAGTVAGKTWEARRCPVGSGAHQISGASPFGIVAYGYGPAGSYALAGGADVERIYEPPPIQ